MHANSEEIRKRLSNGELVLGTVSAFGGAVTGDILGTAGFDAVWLDSEHGPMDKKDILNAVIGSAASGMAAFVRVPWNDPVLVKPILEMGVDGIIFPFVLNADEARRAVASCRYPPQGVRGCGPLRACGYGKIDLQDYVHNYSKRIMVIIQIEHEEAVRNIDSILKVEGIDALIVGPCDLSGSVGKLAQIEDPEVIRLCDIVAEKAVAADMPFGVCTGYNREYLSRWMERGARFLFVDNDCNYLYKGAKTVVDGMRSLVENKHENRI
jgi:2-dehydro-3-deoxyglucarate aldolase/4-hydroxy-2-oxoheptanedioate aldolase